MITEKGMEKASKAIYGLMDGIQVVYEDGKTVKLPMHEGEARPNRVKFMGILSDDQVGKIKQINLLDRDGDVFASKGYVFDKKGVEGLLVSFVFRILENEVI